MKRVILDTNIYEFALKEIDKEMLYGLVKRKIIMIYGSEVIRKELRDIPKERYVRVGDKLNKLRNALLSLYDLLVKMTYPTDEKTRDLAEKYFISYRSFGGFAPKEKIIDDFLIVACASLKNLDVVVSGDTRTMLSSKALSAYKTVNAIEKAKTPGFIGFEDFKNEIRRYASL